MRFYHGRQRYRLWLDFPLRLVLTRIVGSDWKLIRAVERALQSAGWRTNVDTGRLTFPVENGGRNTGDGAIPDDDRVIGTHTQNIAHTVGGPDEL